MALLQFANHFNPIRLCALALLASPWSLACAATSVDEHRPANPQGAVEIDNVRAALDWSFSFRGDMTVGAHLTAAYAPVWLHLSLIGECRDRCNQALPAWDGDPGLTLNQGERFGRSRSAAFGPSTASFLARCGFALGFDWCGCGCA